MTEGDYWISVVGRAHIEKERDLAVGKVLYWCGMKATPAHLHLLYNAKDGPCPNTLSCHRCSQNRAKATTPRETAA